MLNFGLQKNLNMDKAKKLLTSGYGLTNEKIRAS